MAQQGGGRLPVIDLHSDRKTVVLQLRQASRDLGFFQITNHGISSVPEALAAAKDFYAQPLEAKNRHRLVYAKQGELLRGYASLGSEQADVANLSLTRDAVPDLMESFQIADPRFVDGSQFPTPAMRSTLVPLFRQMTGQGQELLALLAEALPDERGGEEDGGVFARRHTGRSRTVLRVTRYPALSSCCAPAGKAAPAPASASESGGTVSRISAHRDLGSLTLLQQDSQGGLEVQDPASGEWVPVPPVPDALVVNVGNLLTRWTAGYFRSSVHRVVASTDVSSQCVFERSHTYCSRRGHPTVLLD